MATSTQFSITDESSGNNATVYINRDNRVYICVGGDLTDAFDSQFITLDADDLDALIKELQRLQKEL